MTLETLSTRALFFVFSPQFCFHLLSLPCAFRYQFHICLTNERKLDQFTNESKFTILQNGLAFLILQHLVIGLGRSEVFALFAFSASSR